jgi:hypothetical protein
MRRRRKGSDYDMRRGGQGYLAIQKADDNTTSWDDHVGTGSSA